MPPPTLHQAPPQHASLSQQVARKLGAHCGQVPLLIQRQQSIHLISLAIVSRTFYSTPLAIFSAEPVRSATWLYSRNLSGHACCGAAHAIAGGDNRSTFNLSNHKFHSPLLLRASLTLIRPPPNSLPPHTTPLIHTTHTFIDE